MLKLMMWRRWWRTTTGGGSSSMMLLLLAIARRPWLNWRHQLLRPLGLSVWWSQRVQARIMGLELLAAAMSPLGVGRYSECTGLQSSHSPGVLRSTSQRWRHELHLRVLSIVLNSLVVVNTYMSY